MPDEASETLVILRKIHNLLELLAEDKIAQRDEAQRVILRQLAGSSVPKQKSILLMDGTRTQADIRRATSVNQGHLSTLVSSLFKENLLSGDIKQPNIAISIPKNFFEDHA